MNESDIDDAVEQVIQRLPDVTASDGMRSVAALNPAAGHHAIPTDVREIRAALRAGERSWRRFPYYARRYGERGQYFTRSDSAWIVTLAQYPQEVVDKQMLWLGSLLSARGMSRWLLQVHLELLYAELVRIAPDRELLYARLLHAAAMLHALRRQYIGDEVGAALATQFDRRVGSALSSQLPETGSLLVAAVADEKAGIERAVISVEEWMTDSTRFPSAWIDAVRAVIQAARAHSAP